MRLAIVTTSNRGVGTGHAVRQLALARSAIRRGAEVQLLSPATDDVADRCRRADVDHVAVADLEDPPALCRTIRSLAVDRLVIDVHERDVAALEPLASEVPTTQVVSEVGVGSPRYGTNAFLVGSDTDVWERVQRVPWDGASTQVRSGRAYTIFRDEFDRDVGPSQPDAGTILIAHGGSDPYDLTLRTMTALERTTGRYEVRVLVGDAFADVGAIRAAAAGSVHRYHLIERCLEPSRWMRRSCVAVINGGNVRYELCRTATPFVAVGFSEEQAACTAQIAGLGAGVDLGTMDTIPDQRCADAVEALLHDHEGRERMRAVMRSLFDGRGRDRILDHVLGSVDA